MSKYTFTFKIATEVTTVSYWANDMMEATAELYSVFPEAIITNTESVAA